MAEIPSDLLEDVARLAADVQRIHPGTSLAADAREIEKSLDPIVKGYKRTGDGTYVVLSRGCVDWSAVYDKPSNSICVAPAGHIRDGRYFRYELELAQRISNALAALVAEVSPT